LGFLVREKERFRDRNVIINLSGRGDKDMEIVGSEGVQHG
jgi:tryptophan synthase beta subunit